MLRPTLSPSPATIPPPLYRDTHVLVIDKPAGLAVHPGPQTPYSLEDHLDQLRFGNQRPPQPAHRLDRDTSGCLALARHPKALKRLNALFEAGAIGKTYLALVPDHLPGNAGMIDAPLLKTSSRAQGWRMTVAAAGKPARTRWQRLAVRDGVALIAFMPETGRTHQIRVHAAHIGCPLLGDPVYGAGDGPMMLHSWRLVIPYADNAAPIRVEAPPPAHWQPYIAMLTDAVQGFAQCSL